MDLATYLAVLRRRLLPFLLCLVAGVSGGVYAGQAPEPVYRATSRTLVTLPVSDDIQNSLAGAQLTITLLGTYATIGTSRSVAEKVATQLQFPGGADAVLGKLDANVAAGTFLIDVAATDSDPQRAKTLADTAAVALGDRVKELESGKLNPVKVQLLDRALLPTTPSSPRPKLDLALGTGLGLAVGLLLVGLLETLDRSIKTPAQGQKAFNAPLLGLVPRRRNGPSLVVTSTSGVEGEPYRTLRTAVQFTDLDVDMRTLLITSATPGDGKTTTAANLAIALAEAGDRVVVIDGDLRRATLAEVFGLEAEVGLGAVIRRQVRLEDALQMWGNRLAVLPAGRPLPPNPSEVLGSQLMAALLDELVALADVVIIDTPPVLPVTDAVALATQVDGVVLVARHGKTSRSAAAEARRRLDAVGANVVGFVLNAVPARDGADYYAEYAYGEHGPARVGRQD